MAPLSALALTPGHVSAPGGSLGIEVTDDNFGQPFEGVGGALTDSAAWEINSLPPAARASLMTRLFSRRGIGLNYLRLGLGGSDFDVNGLGYTYDDNPPGGRDPKLRYFSIRHDRAYIIPLIKLARGINPGLTTEANPWTAPAWMKSNDSLFNYQWSGTLLPKYYGTFAMYITKAVDVYRSAGAPIDIVSPENEPNVPGEYPTMNLAPLGYAGVQPNPKIEATIIRDMQSDLLNSEPALQTEIFGVEASWDRAYFARYLLEHTSIAGIDWHCYTDAPSVMEQFPHTAQYVSECATELNDWSDSDYLTEMFRDGAQVAALWNLALDGSNGPFVGNDGGCGGCSGVVTVGGTAASPSVTYDRRYYDLGQFGRFIVPGALRIASSTYTTFDPAARRFIGPVDDVAFRNPGPKGDDVLVATNDSVEAQELAVDVDAGREGFSYTIPPVTTTTFRWQPPAGSQNDSGPPTPLGSRPEEQSSSSMRPNRRPKSSPHLPPRSTKTL